jgi:DNA-binding NarL/FixJ family response regulator
MSNKEIAYEVGISEGTVKAHLNQMFKKTGCKTRVELAVRFKNGDFNEFLS